NRATAHYGYDDRLRQTSIDVTFGASNQPVMSLHEALGADSIPRMRQYRIGTGATQTDMFQVDADGRIMGESLLWPGINLPTAEIGNKEVGSYMRQGTAWAQYTLDTIGNVKQRET